MTENQEDDNPPYTAISAEVAIQTAKPKALEVLVNTELGDSEGNREREAVYNM
jgi:ATP-dependent DNA helicase 2 subunit 2